MNTYWPQYVQKTEELYFSSGLGPRQWFGYCRCAGASNHFLLRIIKIIVHDYAKIASC